MKRKYTVEVECKVYADPANAKGQAARVQLGSHVQRTDFVGEEAGKLGNVGDADHLAAAMDVVDVIAKQVVRAGVAKGHHYLVTNYADVMGDAGPGDDLGGGISPAAPGSERERVEKERAEQRDALRKEAEAHALKTGAVPQEPTHVGNVGPDVGKLAADPADQAAAAMREADET